MGVFGNVSGVLRGSSSVFMIIVLAVADHLWGENVFNCPCGDYRVLYTSTFLVVPPIAIILIDISWPALFSTCRQNCCCSCEGGCRGACGCCCRCGQCCQGAEGTCCSYQTCETIARLITRPLLIAAVWLVFSCMEPKFGKCIFRKVSCNCTAEELKSGCDTENKEKAAFLRVVTAMVVLGVTCLIALTGLLFMLCRCCLALCRVCCCLACCRRVFQKVTDKCRSWVSHQDPDWINNQRVLTTCLYTLGLEPKTILLLGDQDLMDETRLMQLSDDGIRRVGDNISIGQLEILRVHRRDIRLVRWLLKQEYSKTNIRKILARAEHLGPTLGTVRDSLNTVGEVTDENEVALVNELSTAGIKSGRQQARQQPKPATQDLTSQIQPPGQAQPQAQARV